MVSHNMSDSIYKINILLGTVNGILVLGVGLTYFFSLRSHKTGTPNEVFTTILILDFKLA